MIANLPPQLEEEIQRLVDTGEFDDSTDVLTQGVHLLTKRREQIEHVHEMLQVSVEQFERGEHHEYSQELLDERWEVSLARHKLDVPKQPHGQS